MEILPLMQSYALPLDIVVNNIYNHLWKLKSPLSDDLRDAIQHDHFHLKKSLMIYYKSKDFSHSYQDDDYYLDWFLNDMISVLNDDQILMDGISENLLRECPGMTVAILMNSFVYDRQEIIKNIYALWKLMTHEKKQKMYTKTLAFFS